MMSDAAAIARHLGLAPHPEGGRYRETVRQPAPDGDRDAMTAILFLLDAGERSHWHRIDAGELWTWHAGARLILSIADDAVADGAIVDHALGGAVLAGERPQAFVPPHAWQSAVAMGGWALVSCVVAPAFDVAAFELAPPGWRPKGTMGVRQ